MVYYCNRHDKHIIRHLRYSCHDCRNIQTQYDTAHGCDVPYFKTLFASPFTMLALRYTILCCSDRIFIYTANERNNNFSVIHNETLVDWH